MAISCSVVTGKSIAQVVAELNRRILVVDDHLDTLRLLETVLSLCGFDVAAATNVPSALRLAANGIDAIATDLAMPGTDGIEFIRRVRAGRSKPRIPIIAVTGQAIDSSRIGPADLDCCRIVLKPCDVAAVADLLHELIDTCVHDCKRCPARAAVPPTES